MVLLFGVFGCQKDDFQPSQLEENKGQIPIAEIKNKSYKELKDNQKFQEAMEVVTRQKVSKDENVKTIMGFTIDSTVIKEITVGGHTSYTMYVMDGSLEGGIFKNLVVQRDSLGHVKSSLITYYPEHTNLDTGHGSFMFQGTYIAEPCTTEGLKLWNRSNSNCTEIWYCSWGGTIHFAGENCTESYMFSTMSCGSGGGGGGSGDGIPGSGTTDGNEDWVDPHFPIPVNPVENEGEESQDPIITTPIYSIQYKQQIIDCFSGTGYLVNVSGLSFNQQRDLAQYLKQDTNNDPFDNSGTNCSDPQALAFAFEAIEAILEGGEVDFEENIIYDNSLNDFPCHKITIQEATGSCSLLTQLVIDAFEANDYVNLIFEASNTINSNANTTSNTVYDPTTNSCNITIKFRESYLQEATDLSIARTAIHESLHAILVYMYEEGLLESEDGLPMEGFEDFVEAYTNYMSGLPENIGMAHHELMTDFIEEMATSLSTYALENGYSNSFNFYKKLCWSGDLINTPTFQSLYPQYVVPSDEINNPTNINPDFLDIININAAEQDNTTYIYPHPNGTTYEHSPKGNPPNSDEPCN